MGRPGPLAKEMKRCEITLSQLGYLSDLNSTHTIKSIVNRLPFHMKAKWADHAYKILASERVEPQFTHLTKFIECAQLLLPLPTAVN